MDSIESFFGQREFLPMNWWPIHYKWKIQKYLDKDDVVVVAVYCRILMMNRRCYDPCLIFFMTDYWLDGTAQWSKIIH